MRYEATIHHHSISSARSIVVDGTLKDAQIAANAEFGDGFEDHKIVVYEEDPTFGMVPVASRRIGSTAWQYPK